jgi:hypothetical protein
VLADSAGAVVTTDVAVAEPYQTFGNTAVMGCLRSDDRERLLVRYDFGSVDGENGVAQAAVAGPYAAVNSFSTDFHYEATAYGSRSTTCAPDSSSPATAVRRSAAWNTNTGAPAAWTMS